MNAIKMIERIIFRHWAFLEFNKLKIYTKTPKQHISSPQKKKRNDLLSCNKEMIISFFSRKTILSVGVLVYIFGSLNPRKVQCWNVIHSIVLILFIFVIRWLRPFPSICIIMLCLKTSLRQFQLTCIFSNLVVVILYLDNLEHKDRWKELIRCQILVQRH